MTVTMAGMAERSVSARMAAAQGRPEQSTNSGDGKRQSRRMSLIEALTNVAVGYALAVLTQVAMLPAFGLRASVGDTLAIGAVFTAVSLARIYLLRRIFERLRMAGT